jgi:hypothetical protein
MASAHDQVKGVIGVGQRLPEHRLVDPHPARRLLPGQAHHHRARIKGADLGPSLQQFTQVKTRAAGCVQNLSAADRPQRGQHRRPVVVRVGRTVRRMLLEAQTHPVVGIPEVLIHAHTMAHAGNAGRPSQRCHLVASKRVSPCHRHPLCGYERTFQGEMRASN